MAKILKLLLLFLLLITLLELGYLVIISKSGGGLMIANKPVAPSVTPNPTPYASPVIDKSATPVLTLNQQRTSRNDWNEILKMRTSNTVVYEAPLENIRIKPPTTDDIVELALIFNEERHLMQTFGGRDMGLIKTYEKIGSELKLYDYHKLKPGDIIELRITTEGGLEQEIIIIKTG